MKYNRLGDSGLLVSDLCLGTMIFGEESARGTALAEAQRMIDHYLEIIPDATISEFRHLPFKNIDDTKRFEEGLRKAGLPE